MNCPVPDQRTGRLPARRFLWALLALWGGFAIWLLLDREPTQKEMTFAYRKHQLAASQIADPRARNRYREQLHNQTLAKQDCRQSGERQYQCAALLLGPDGASPLRAVFTHDRLGWSYAALP